MHKHHIIPRHLGGTNESENLVEVSVEEHAKIHHSLWILGGRWQDELAWRGLTKQIGKDEARRMAVSRALKGKSSHRKGKTYPGHSEKMKGKTWKCRYSPPCSKEHRNSIASTLSKEWIVIGPTGETFKIKNLRKFCKDHQLNSGNMISVSKGRLKHSGKWKCFQCVEE